MDKRTWAKAITTIIGMVVSMFALCTFIFAIDISKGRKLILIVLAIVWIITGISNLIEHFGAKGKDGACSDGPADKMPNSIIRANLTWIAIVSQAAFLNSAADHLYMFRVHPDDGGYRWAFIISLVALLLCSTWMVSNHRFEPDKDQRRKNTKIELLYCSIQALIGLFMIHLGIGLVGTALILVVCLGYIFYINPKFMNRKLTR